jgi:hypothetical protein
VTPPPREVVQVTETEEVVPYGTARTSWYVRTDGRWQKVAEFPGATLETLDRGAGTVWARRVLLELPAGTELLAVRTAPRRGERRDPFAYLRQEARGTARKAVKTRYRVERGGALRVIREGSSRP